MVSFPSPASYKFNTFKGIRTRNGVAQEGVISATVCQNVDFVPSSYDAGVLIKSAAGNYKICTYSDNSFNIIKGFESVQEGTHYILFYMESSAVGKLVRFNPSGSTFETLVDNLSVTGEANGITLKDSAYDVFVFTNGVDYYSVKFFESLTITKLEPEYNGSAVTGLALCEQDGSLVIGCNEGVVLASKKGDITDWDYAGGTGLNKPWYQLFGKKVTAVVPYIDALLVFTEDDSTVLSGNMSDADSAIRQDASLGGCMSFESWCRHDKYLFFYDNKQKNIYYYMQNNYGQKVLGEPIAPEVQKFFNNITRLQMVSYIGNNRSEIWLLSNNFKLIYDYFVGEWSERKCQELTSYFVYNNDVFSTAGQKCFREKEGNTCLFDNVYYPAEYKMQIINLGSFSNLKEMEIQPLFTVSTDSNNAFCVDCLINGKKTKTKRLEMFSQGAVWADDTEEDETTPENELWAEDGEDDEDQNVIGQVFPDENDSIIRQIKGKFISNWYYLQFTIRTETQGDDFSITGFELKGITQDTDTIGVK